MSVDILVVESSCKPCTMVDDSIADVSILTEEVGAPLLGSKLLR